MRIDPSKLAEPLAHVMGAGAADATRGKQATSGVAAPAGEDQLEQLDVLLMRRLRLNATADAANSVVSFQDAQQRADRLREQVAADPSAATRAQGSLDATRVRGLLHGD